MLKENFIFNFFLKLVVFTAISSCDVKWENSSSIPPETEKSIDSLNNIVISALVDDKPNIIRSLASNILIAKSNNDLSFFVDVVSRNIYSSAYKKLDQFYIKGLPANVDFTLLSSSVVDHGYEITIRPLNETTVVTIGEFQQAKQSFLLLTSFGKYRDTWKLNILHFGLNKIAYKDAIDWYEDSKADFAIGDTLSAVNKIKLINDLLRPGGEYWSYQKEAEIIKWKEKIEAIVNR